MTIKQTIRRPDRQYVKNDQIDRFNEQVQNEINSITTYIRIGNGTPESNISADPGSIYLNKTIASGEYAFYIKRTGTGSTGWEGLGTVLP